MRLNEILKANTKLDVNLFAKVFCQMGTIPESFSRRMRLVVNLRDCPEDLNADDIEMILSNINGIKMNIDKVNESVSSEEILNALNIAENYTRKLI